MHHPSIPILLVGVGMLVVLALVVLFALNVRRAVVLDRAGAVQCQVARSLPGRREVWQHGVLQVGNDRLRWFRDLSLLPGPQLMIPRRDILEVERERLVEPAGPAGPGGPAPERVLVAFFLRGGRTVQALMDAPAAAALQSWLEAAPTGLVLGDAD